MKRQYESPDLAFYKVLLPVDVLVASEDQDTGTEIGGSTEPTGAFDGPEF